MPRALRIEYPGAICHVMNRGDRREPIFHDDRDHARFLETLGEACTKTDWQVHAYCLLKNHFHPVVETPSANLVAGMRWCLSTYTARFNRNHSRPQSSVLVSSGRRPARIGSGKQATFRHWDILAGAPSGDSRVRAVPCPL